MEAIKETFSFWFKEILPGAFNSAVKWLGIRGILMELIVSFLAAYIYFLSEETPNIIDEVGKIALITFCFWGFIFSITLIAFIFGYPVKLNKEQNKRIDELTPSPLNISIGFPEMKPIKEGRKKREFLTLEAFNNNRHIRIEELRAELRTIIRYDADKTRKIHTSPNIPQLKLTWENKEKITSIRPGEGAYFYLCEIDRDTNATAFGFGEDKFHNPLFEKESVFQLSIFLTGRLEGEIKFHTTLHTQTIYAFPEKSRLSIGNNALEKYGDIPELLRAILRIGQRGLPY